MSYDLINGCFELFGAGLTAATSVRAILRDKKIAGFSPVPTAFFTAWGVWNLIYYPSLDQWLSFIGGVAIVGVNSVYLFLIWKYHYAAQDRSS